MAELQPELHEVIVKSVKRIRKSVVVNKTDSVIIWLKISDAGDTSCLWSIIHAKLFIEFINQLESGGLVEEVGDGHLLDLVDDLLHQERCE